MEKHTIILNNIREEIILAFGRKRIGSFGWDPNKKCFTASSGGYVLNTDEKRVIRDVLSKHRIAAKFFSGRNEAGVKIEVDDAGLTRLVNLVS